MECTGEYTGTMEAGINAQWWEHVLCNKIYVRPNNFMGHVMAHVMHCAACISENRCQLIHLNKLTQYGNKTFSDEQPRNEYRLNHSCCVSNVKPARQNILKLWFAVKYRRPLFYILYAIKNCTEILKPEENMHCMFFLNNQTNMLIA